MKTLRAHGFSQRPRFEQVVGYLERNEPLPGPAGTPAEATDEDLAQMCQGGGNRFGEDWLETQRPTR